MRLKSMIVPALVTCLVFTGCSKKFSLHRGEEIPPSNWPFARKNIRATAVIESDFQGLLNLKWEERVSESPIGPLNIGAGNLIFCGTKGRVRFYDTRTGKYRGGYKAKRSIQTGLIVVDSMAYFGVGPNRDEFSCINLFGRKTLWSLRLKDVTGAPIIMSNRLYVGSSMGMVYCLDRMTGSIIWKDSTGSRTLAGPSGDDEVVYFPFDDGTLWGLTAKTGKMVFKSELAQPLVSKCVVGSKVYVAGADGGFFAVDKKTGQVTWEKEFSHPIWTSPALDDGILFFGDNGGAFRALDENDGSILWEFKTGGVILSSPIVVGEYVLFASLDRFLYCLEKKTGHLMSKREFKHGIRFPAVSDGRMIYVAAHDGTIQCLGD